jgi:nucleotide-binding universal stress UspA family protein
MSHANPASLDATIGAAPRAHAPEGDPAAISAVHGVRPGAVFPTILSVGPDRAAAAIARFTGARLLEWPPGESRDGRALAALARREAADLVVVAADAGSSQDIGRLVRPPLDSGLAVLAIPRGAPADLRLDRIGVGYDGGAPAQRALACAVDLVKLAGGAVASLNVAYVDDGDTPPDQRDARGLHSARDAMIEWWLDLLGDDVPALVRPLRLEGDPAEALADLSQDLDLLVIGTRPRSRLRRLVAGSVSTGLLTRTHCALLVLPER